MFQGAEPAGLRRAARHLVFSIYDMSQFAEPAGLRRAGRVIDY